MDVLIVGTLVCERNRKMGLSQDLIIQIIKTIPDPDLAAKQIKDYERIQDLILGRKDKIRQIRNKAHKEIEELMAEKICHHEFTRRCQDPSGGSDNEVECAICGENISHRAVRFT